MFGWEWKVLQMKTESVSNFFIFHFKRVYLWQKLSENSVFRTTYVGKYDINVQLKPGFLQHISLRRSKLTKTNDNSNNVHFSGIRFIWRPYFANVNNDKMRATNESYVKMIKMNAIVIFVSKIHILHSRLAFVQGKTRIPHYIY